MLGDGMTEPPACFLADGIALLNVGDGEQAGTGSVGGHGRHPLMSAASRGQMLVSFGTARQAGRGSKNLTIGFLPILYFWRENRAKESADSCS